MMVLKTMVAIALWWNAVWLGPTEPASPPHTPGAEEGQQLAQAETPSEAETAVGTDEAAGASIRTEQLHGHVPDPDVYREQALEERQQAEAEGDRGKVKNIDRVIDSMGRIRRPERMRLSLEEAIHRTLANSYAIEVARYNPAIEATRVVEAQAAFDAVFFTNIQKNNIDRPSGSQLQSTDLDTFSLSSGVRKLLITGTQLQGSFELGRTRTNLAFQQLNPEYTSNFNLDIRQPLLRNFGIDFNRSVIVLRQNDRRISYWTFRRQVRDLLRQAEEAYWRLAQARRDVVITARLLADFEQILEYLDARKDFDIIPVQLNSTKASLEQSRADFVVRVANVFNAEDQLIALMNSSDVDLADDIEIIPTEPPQQTFIAVDRLAEVQTALEYRPELQERRLAVANAKLAVGQARNAELPRFDVTFRQRVDGLGSTMDKAFDEATRGNFIEYLIGVEFEVPIGNRGPRAATKRARLLYNQAVAGLKQQFEDVILDVNLAVRQLSTSFDQIAPSFESAEARKREVESIVARAERKDFVVLQNELSARQSLASSRRAMLTALVEYNIAIIDLERAKGTLLNYNNVEIPSDTER